MTDHRDLTIRLFADEERELLERLARLQDDVLVYRELLHAALDALVAVTRRHARLRAEHEQMEAAYAALRETCVLGAEPA